MPLTASSTSGGNSTPAPAGTHVARCVRVVDLGTQKDDGQFGVKIQPKVMLAFELPTELHTFKEENGPEPYMVSKEYTLNLGEKANLRKDLESWRGRPFTEEELKGFNVGKLLDKTCTLSIIHKPTKSGGLAARISGIGPSMKGVTTPPAITEKLLYDVDSGKDATYHKLPEWVRKRIDACENWKQQVDPGPEPESDPDWDAGTSDNDF